MSCVLYVHCCVFMQQAEAQSVDAVRTLFFNRTSQQWHDFVAFDSAGLQALNTEPDVSQIYSQFGIKTSATFCAKYFPFCYPSMHKYRSIGGPQHGGQPLCLNPLQRHLSMEII